MRARGRARPCDTRNVPVVMNRLFAGIAGMQVAAGPRLQRPRHLDIAGKGRQHNDARVGKLRADGSDSLEAGYVGHLQVHQRHVRAVLAKELDRLPAVGGLGRQDHVGLVFDQGSDALAEQRVVVDGEDANARIVTHSSRLSSGDSSRRSALGASNSCPRAASAA